MPHREIEKRTPARNAAEDDCHTGWRHVLCYMERASGMVKRRTRRRERRERRAELRLRDET